MSEKRIKKINDLLRDEVALIFLDEFDFGDETLVTVVNAEVSKTLEHANIKISVFPVGEAKPILDRINKNIFNVQQRLNRRLVMRKVPKIRFEIDKTEEHASHIENILGDLKK